MANNKPRLLIVSMNKKAAIFLKNSLKNVFEDKLAIDAYSFLDDDKEVLLSLLSLNPEMAMATGVMSYHNLLEQYPAEKCILGSRDISAPEYFDKLFLIPKGKKVLVINETRNGAVETIEAIQRLGINHISYVPYWQWPDCDVDTAGIDTAISPGMLHYCPETIINRVDIGMRNLSIPTFMKVLHTFGFGTEYIDKYIGYQKKVLINTYEKLSVEYRRSDKLRNSLQTILDELDEAIISIGTEGKITGVNAAAEKLLGMSADAALNQSIYDIFKDIPKTNLQSQTRKRNLVLTINNNQIYLTYIPLSNDDTNIGILKLNEVKDIQKNEEQIRKIIYQKNKGHVAKYFFDDILTGCNEMETIIENTRFFARTDSTILITGESGTGKEMLAQSIHNHSSRAKNPFIAVNFAALPHNLVESELFGYEEGAFTGAKKSGKKGLFELAHTGTIFLDEIGHASLWMQTRLLRVLEEREIMRLGDTKIIPVDIRVIVATNKDLKKLVAEEKFLADLYYRINVFRIHIPPLRDRKESIPPLIGQLLKKGGYNKTFSPEAMQYILGYGWNGNVRELKNMIEYSVQIAKGDRITVEDLPYDIYSYEADLQEQKHDDCEITYFKLKTLFDIEQIMLILELLSENRPGVRKIGRNNIISIFRESGFAVSERTVRTMMKYISDCGLVTIGRTKQGTMLSRKGEALLDLIKRQEGGYV